MNLNRRRRRPYAPIRAALVALFLVVSLGVVSGVARAATCATNAIVCENAQAGVSPSVWDVHGPGDDSVQGFATDISVNLGGTISFKIQAQSAYTIDIYRLGYYGGMGARLIASLPGAFPPQNQSVSCVSNSASEILDCGTWAVSASWTVPATVVSGVYIAKLTRTDLGGSSHIPFVVRNDASTSKLLFKTSDASWQAYNAYGGADFYQGNVHGRAYKVSYNRPYGTRNDGGGQNFVFSNEYPMIRFLERNGYDVSYTTDVDADRYGSLLKNHKVFLSVGHDEYWSGPERSNVEAARDAGVNLAFFSGNEVYWRTRWESSVDGLNTSYRTLVCYKETWDNAKTDPSPEWTGTWRDPRFSPPSNGGLPENSLTGTMYLANHDDLALQVPPAQGTYRLWRNTTVAALANANQTATLPAHTIGYESDEAPDNFARPPGLIYLSTTTGSTPQYLRDFGNTVTPGTTTHHMTLYKASSGALVFSAGTIQFAWGLDANHDSATTPLPADPSMQQMVVNLFADMGVQPATLITGLVAPAAPIDVVAPWAWISLVDPGATVSSGQPVTVTGGAGDLGGVVAGVEVSTDGGTSWHPASGTTSWTYSFYATGISNQTVKVRAIDDSANIGIASALTLQIAGPYTMFGQRVPGTAAVTDTTAVELGLRFTPQDNGYVTGVRFYKGSGNSGAHTGSLWSATGTRLATGTFTGETATGWQTLTFPNPVQLTAGTTYVVSYFAPIGHYAYDPMVFSYNNFGAPPLSAARTTTTYASGVFANGDRFPSSNTLEGGNYYVDPVFVDSDVSPPFVVSTTPPAGGRYAPVGVRPAATFSMPVSPASIQFRLANGDTLVPGSTSYDSTSRTATFTPLTNLATSTTYTATVTAVDLSGQAMSPSYAWSFTTDAYANVATLFAPDMVPASPSANDPNAVELGVAFTTAVNGLLVGVRFYKGINDTGTHVGTLWTVDGSQLATATFTNETASGWQSVEFANPVLVTAGTTYVASYYAPNGGYAADTNYFTNPVTHGSMTAPAGGNGLFMYGSHAFPTSSFQSTNYWIDPLYVPGGTLPPSPSCTATYSILFQWPGGFQGQVQVTSGNTAINGWTVTWTFPDGQTVTGNWNATVTSNGSSVTAANMSYNGALAAGASTTFGFLGTWNNSTNTLPTLSCTPS